MFTSSCDQMLQCPPRPLQIMDRMSKPNVEIAPNCPRCASSNTKFCYYNNYSLSQPRYFCKGCRRYWTRGGSLRNVPVGGGCRKNRRGKSSRQLPQSQRVSNPSNNIEQPEFMTVPDLVPNDSNPQSDSQNCLNSSAFESQKPVEEGDILFQGLGQDEKVQEFMEDDDVNAFGLQSLLEDEVVQDVLWSDTASLPNLMWQPMVQVQELESFQSNDQLRISTNQINDCWSSLDLSGFEVFSRP
ncbi:hypothetical protein RGQ29_010501 [Quercus rubra]|uniref:Dof zinc finger protein n=1 Tax=Quercus rubra TaxID=3512 RepID=A0AAN7J7H0_QUERU|nr:hypothetical protein RGQ29_010501 [Quercus rubra]